MSNGNKHITDQGAVKRSSLDTLAQLETKHQKGCSCSGCDDDIKLNKSTGVDDSRRLTNRAKRKYLGVSLSLGLVDVAKDKRDSTEGFEDFNQEQQNVRSYWNMYHCARKLEHKNGKVTGRYCKNRLCLVCNSIRQAVLMNNYNPVIENWADVYFVTLTIENVKGQQLKSAISEMQNIVKRVQGRIKKQLQRQGAENMKGIRKLECTYNPTRNDYHPHYHLIIDGYQNARLFRKYWVQSVAKSSLINCKLTGRNKNGKRVFLQDIRPATGKVTRELFKYFTKIISSSDKEKLIYLQSLHTIFKAIKGKRTFQSFGFKLPKEQKAEQPESYELDIELEASYQGEEEEDYIWHQQVADWVSNVSGQLLSNHKLSDTLKDIPKRMIKGKHNKP